MGKEKNNSNNNKRDKYKARNERNDCFMREKNKKKRKREEYTHRGREVGGVGDVW